MPLLASVFGLVGHFSYLSPAMNTIDLIVGGLLLLSLISGWRAGFVRQVLSLAGLLAATWLAIHYGDTVGGWLHVEASAAPAAGFIVVLVVVGLSSAIAAWSISKLFHLVGFGIPDRLLGAVVSMLKTCLILSGLFWAMQHMNMGHDLFSPTTIEESRTYKPVSAIAEKLFPSLRWLGEQVPSPHEDQ